MKLIRNKAGISALILILLLFVAAIIGAVLSYMWTMGYYVSLGLQLPKNPTMSITSVDFDPQDPTYFNLTLLNPSFSNFDVSVEQVMVSMEDGVLDTVGTYPTLGELPIGESETFRCFWDWADYTGENVRIYVFIAEGSGATFQKKTPLVDLVITEAVFNSTISINHFNMTVQNSASSVTYVNLTSVMVDTETVQDVTPSLPYTLNPNASVAFVCSFNWTDYQGEEVTVKVGTSQGYAAYYTQATQQRVALAITDVEFNITDPTHFNVTVQNNASSPTHVDVTGITVKVNETTQEITELNVTLPYVLHPNSTVTFVCTWEDWTSYQGMTVLVTIHTKQGFEIPYTRTIPEG